MVVAVMPWEAALMPTAATPNERPELLGIRLGETIKRALWGVEASITGVGIQRQSVEHTCSLL